MSEGTMIDQGEAEDIFGEETDFEIRPEGEDGQSSENEDEELDENTESSDEKEGEFSQDSKSYKELQRVYTQGQDRIKDVENQLGDLERVASQYGGIDRMAEMIQYATTNPEISAAIQKAQQTQGTGINMDELDDQGKKALELVDKIVENKLAARLQEYQTHEIDPIVDAHRVDRVEKLMGQMDEKYGDRWSDSLDSMKNLSETLPRNVLVNPSFNDMEDLFFKALRSEGRFDDFMGETYQQTIQEKKKRSVSKPKTTRSSMPTGGKPANMFEAAELAAKKLGM